MITTSANIKIDKKLQQRHDCCFSWQCGFSHKPDLLFAGIGNLGYRVILAEYPGYGARKGSPSETTLISNGVETLKQVLHDFGGPVFLWGESLGSVFVSGHNADRADSGKALSWSRHLIAWPMLPNTITGFFS